jgi:uncharacterized membrane protein YccC
MAETTSGGLTRIGQFTKLVVARENPATLLHAARTAVAAVASYLVARLFQLPEAYWAPIATLIAMQPTLGAALPGSAQNFTGTAIGAAVGAVTAAYFPGNVWAFGIDILLVGMFCTALHIERSAHRFAGVTLVIVMLVTRSTSASLIAIHRFIEVSLGIAVGLILSAVWPEPQSENPDIQRK